MHGGKEPGRQGGVLAVKIGGSVATVKEKPFTLRLRALERIAWQLARAQRSHGTRYGVVLGGGSFGHVVAHELQEGGAPASEALSAVTAAMEELARVVADVLMLNGLRPIVYPPHGMCRPRGLKPNCMWDVVVDAFRLGATPLLYGDAYPCGDGWCIVSGDELVVEMACRLGASHVIYLTDVDGVYDHEGRLVRRIRVGDLARLAAPRGRRTGYDVTGGLARKVEAMVANWCPELRGVWVLNGLAGDERLYQLLQGDTSVPATLVEP